MMDVRQTEADLVWLNRQHSLAMQGADGWLNDYRKNGYPTSLSLAIGLLEQVRQLRIMIMQRQSQGE